MNVRVARCSVESDHPASTFLTCEYGANLHRRAEFPRDRALRRRRGCAHARARPMPPPVLAFWVYCQTCRCCARWSFLSLHLSLSVSPACPPAGGGANAAPAQPPQTQFTNPKRARDFVSLGPLGNGGGVPDRAMGSHCTGLTLPVLGRWALLVLPPRRRRQPMPLRATRRRGRGGRTRSMHAPSLHPSPLCRTMHPACTQILHICTQCPPCLPPSACHPVPTQCPPSACTQCPPSVPPACRPTSRPTHSAAPLARLPRAPHR